MKYQTKIFNDSLYNSLSCLFHCLNLSQYLKNLLSQFLWGKAIWNFAKVFFTKDSHRLPKKNGICSWVFKVYWKTYTIEISEYSTFTTFEEVHLSTKYQAPGINLHKISSLQASLKDVFFISIDLASLVNLIGSIRSFR